MQAFREEVARVNEDGFTQEELDAGRNALIDRNRTLRASDGNLASQLLNNLELERTMQFRKELEAKLQSLTLDELNSTFNKHITSDVLNVVRAGDFRKVANE